MRHLKKTEVDAIPAGALVDYLGSWCFQKPCLGIDKNYSVFPYIWQDKIKLNQDSVKVSKICKILFGKFSEILNEIHGENLPIRYWKILTQSWFDNYVHTFYDRYKNIIKYRKLTGDFSYKTLEPEKFVTPLDMREMKYLCEHNGLFNEQLYSQILDSTYNQHIKFYADSDYKWIIPHARLSSKIVLSSLYCSLETTQEIKTNLDKLGEISIYPQLENGFDSYSLSTRRLIFDTVGSECKSRFEELFFKSLVINTPKLIIEALGDVRKYILSNVMLPKLMVTTVSHDDCFLAQLIMAESTKIGGKIIWGQHGPDYGALYLRPERNHEFENPDKYLCWGWADSNDKHKKNLPSLSISERKKFDTVNDNYGPLLFISNASGKYIKTLSTGTFSTDFTNYSKNQCVFIEKLQRRISDNMSYRPYLNDYGQGIIDNVQKLKPSIDYIYGGNIDKLYNKFRLIVMDMPYTSFGTLLALNKPSILILEKNNYFYNPKFSHVFELLYIAGILHYCPIKAADFVNRVFVKPNNWWNSDDAQNARIEYIKYFANNDINYSSIWADNLLKEYNNN
ncbi:hypothetical protein OAM02_00400 [Verrucomicrobia bacterium]|nr:hypothetical protein [Verrucomicrobiota bacterium]